MNSLECSLQELETYSSQLLHFRKKHRNGLITTRDMTNYVKFPNPKNYWIKADIQIKESYSYQIIATATVTQDDYHAAEIFAVSTALAYAGFVLNPKKSFWERFLDVLFPVKEKIKEKITEKETRYTKLEWDERFKAELELEELEKTTKLEIPTTKNEEPFIHYQTKN